MFRKLRRRLMPVTLSRALQIVGHLHRHSQTPRWYQTPVNQLIDLYGDVKVTEVTADMVGAWHDLLDKNGYSPWTVDSYTRSLKAFFNHLKALGYVDFSPAANLRLRKLPKKAPKDLAAETIEKLIQYSRHSARDHAVVMTLYATGCRVGELVSMLVRGVHLGPEGGRILVSGKGNKTRFVFFDAPTARALEVYLATRPFNAADELWLAQNGRPLTVSGVYYLLKRTAQRAGIRGRFNPHSFRHSAVKRWIAQGMPMRVVQELAGHDQITTTMSMYASYTDEELERLFHQYAGSGKLQP